MPPAPSPRPRSLLALGAVALGLGVAVACSTTTDPVPGSGGLGGGGGGGGGGGASGGLSSSGGIQAEAGVAEAPRACGPAPGAAAPFTKAALLGAAAQCSAWHACEFYNAALALRDATKARALAPSEATTTAAQTAWKAAMAAWSASELFQFGPPGPKSIDKYHGRGLRTFVHPWPDVNRCQVETQVALKEYADPAKGFNFVLPSGRGLFALEYVHFYPGTDVSCLPNAQAAQVWAGLAPDLLVQAKNDYAVAVSENVLAVGRELVNVWDPAGENFTPKLLAFDGYGSEQETLNVVAWSLMYPEQEIKDLKVAPLAGYAQTPPNPETPFARVEIENIRANLRAFRRLFQGCGDGGVGVGFDDWLVASGNQPLAAQLVSTLDTAQAAADAFPAFSAATPAQFESFYTALRGLSNLLKTNFFGSASPLNLKLPASAASDTD